MVRLSSFTDDETARMLFGKVVQAGGMRTVWGFRIVQVPGECLFTDVEAGKDEWMNESIEDS